MPEHFKSLFNKKIDTLAQKSDDFLRKGFGVFAYGSDITWFDQIKSRKDLGWRSASLLTAPLAYTALSLEFIFISAFMFIKSAVDCFTNSAIAKESAGMACSYFLVSLIGAVCALISPFANFIDLAISGIATLATRNTRNSAEEIPMEVPGGPR